MTPAIFLADWSWTLDGPIVLVAVLCGIAASVPGTFLVLRRMSLLGDAISHAVLPGLAAAFFLTGSRDSLPMFAGAVVVGALTAFFSGWISRTGQVDEGASLGVVFTSLFAIGLVMMVRAADTVDLDVSCVLYGSIETVVLDQTEHFGVTLPRAAWTIATVALINGIFVGLFYKELMLSSFDAGLATASGFSAAVLHYGLMILVAITAVACFESVGSVLVVAMFVVPPATAYLLTRRLAVMIALSVAIAVSGSIIGYAAAIEVPRWFSLESTKVAGAVSVVLGTLFLAALAFSPTAGVVPRWWRERRLRREILIDDVLAYLFRVDERSLPVQTTFDTLRSVMLCKAARLRWALRRLEHRGDVVFEHGQYALTEVGRSVGQTLVRSHRLWETYLQDNTELAPNRLHVHAERLEHFTRPELREALGEEITGQVDPHGSPIPER